MLPRELDDNVRDIADKVKEGTIIPFIGAGATQRADGRCPPTGRALCDILARSLHYINSGTSSLGPLALPTVAQHFELKKKRPQLIALLKREIGNSDYLPSPVHLALSRIVKEFPENNLIITTNYDRLMERALGPPVNHRFDVLVQYPHKPNDNPDYGCPKGAVAIYKIHGCLERLESSREKDSLVVTEDDYLDFLASVHQGGFIPWDFVSRMSRSSFLFLGYGLQDWDFMVLYKSLIEFKNRAKMQVSFAIQKSFAPAPPESLTFWENTKSYWLNKNIVTLEIDQEEFMKALLAKLGIKDGEG